MARARRKVDPVKETVETILKRKNINYGEWEKEVINKKKLQVMADEDKDWTAGVIKEASMDLIMEDVKENSKKKEHINNTSASQEYATTANAN